MPELPEVETVATDLKKYKLIGCTIVKAAVHWPRIIATPLASDFVKRIKGQTVQGISRIGKFIVLKLSKGDTLLIHLRMTGRLDLLPSDAPKDSHEHVVLQLSDGRDLRFRDTRKFGRWYLLQDPMEKLGTLGPGPFDDDFDEGAFINRFLKKNRALKPLLLDQSFIAGLGNIYVDEALWEAKLHPCESSTALKRNDIITLRAAILRVLKDGIENLGTSMGKSRVNFYSIGGRRGRHQDHLKAFRKTGQPCPRCKTPIQRIMVAQRSTHFCPQCQKKRRRAR